MGELLAILSLLMFSLNVIVTKTASGRLSLDVGFMISISVNVLFSFGLFIIRLVVDSDPLEFHNLGFLMFAASGVFASYLGRSLYFDSIARLGPSKASTFMVSSPLFTFLMAWLFLDETLSYWESLGVVVVLLGLFVVSYNPSRKYAAAGQHGEVALPLSEVSKWQRWRGLVQPGAALALLGAVSYALGNITRGTAIQDWNEPVLGGLLGALTGVILQFIFNKKVRHIISSLHNADSKAVRLYVISGVLTISAQIAHIAAMHYIPVSIATLITTAQPLLVIPLSYFLLKNQEGINIRIIAGSLLVLLGISTILLLP
ncbi:MULTISPECIES: EamA family transporter [unclassified Paenibacillus]|uniref:EamA family transporter n=1 Tax=unclassified Paenibacillus TaxID=185978 RepID=UPI003640D564